MSVISEFYTRIVGANGTISGFYRGIVGANEHHH